MKWNLFQRSTTYHFLMMLSGWNIDEFVELFTAKDISNLNGRLIKQKVNDLFRIQRY